MCAPSCVCLRIALLLVVISCTSRAPLKNCVRMPFWRPTNNLQRSPPPQAFHCTQPAAVRNFVKLVPPLFRFRVCARQHNSVLQTNDQQMINKSTEPKVARASTRQANRNVLCTAGSQQRSKRHATAWVKRTARHSGARSHVAAGQRVARLVNRRGHAVDDHVAGDGLVGRHRVGAG